MTLQLNRFLSIACVSGVLLAGCRGMTRKSPPVHPVLNMDYQQRFDPQERNDFFANESAMRMPVPGTVKRGGLRTVENAPLEYGRTASGDFVQENPVEVTAPFLDRGKERFNIYCSVCHGYAGDGRGIIMVGNGGTGYGYVPAPTYHSDRLRNVEDGYLYNVILNGYNNMPSYGHEIGVQDRWAIVAYIRALQASQDASAEDVPEPVLDRLRTFDPNVQVDP